MVAIINRMFFTWTSNCIRIEKCSAHPLKFYSHKASNLFEFIKVDKIGKRKNIALITINRPKALNALCNQLMKEMNVAIKETDHNNDIGVIVITGTDKAFAAGADIKEMMNNSFSNNVLSNFLENWNIIASTRKPIIAAVNGYALGGGCELAMMCDIIYASDKAKFGQPEIAIGTIPGAGGTQRLTRALGKSRAMEIILSGRQFTAQEAEQNGLISKVVAANQLIPETIILAEKIAAHSHVTLAMAKDAINKAFESTLQQGLEYEKRLFWATFATRDQKEGMIAFIEKRSPKFTNE